MSYLAILLLIMGLPVAALAGMLSFFILCIPAMIVEEYVGEIFAIPLVIIAFSVAFTNFLWTMKHFAPWAMSLIGSVA